MRISIETIVNHYSDDVSKFSPIIIIIEKL